MQCAVRLTLMKDEQFPIASWMQRVMTEKGWSAEEWASKAKVAPTSITRAVKPGYKFVTKKATVDKLASVAGSSPDQAQPSGVNADVLETMLGVLLRHAPKGGYSGPGVRRLAEALEYGLELVERNPAIRATPGAIAMAAEAAADRLRASPGEA